MSFYLTDDALHWEALVNLEPKPTRCCAKCRRGTLAHSSNPECGYRNRECPNECHRGETR